MTVVAGGVALVTGAASGMGRAAAQRFHAGGMTVCCVDIDDEGVGAVAAAIGGLAVVADVADPAQVQAAVQRCVEELGAPDLAFLNAGIGSGMTIDHFDVATYQRQRGINLDGVVYGVDAVRRAMVARSDGRRGGSIAVTASTAGLQAFPGDPVYTLTKWALIGFMRSIAISMAPEGISVHTICPGLTDTGFLGEVRAFLVANEVPMITPEQIADAVVHMVSRPPETTGTVWVFSDPDQLEPTPFAFAELPPDPTAERIMRALGQISD